MGISMTVEHDPSEYVRGLQQLLISDKKKVAFLFGAGTSLAKKKKSSLVIPAIGKMTNDIEIELNKEGKYRIALAEIREEIESNGAVYTIESMLTNIEQKIQIIGNGQLNKLSVDDFRELLKEIKRLIQSIVSVHEEILKKDLFHSMIHVDFAEWIGRANRKHPFEIFTTNYDYFIELGMEKKNIPFYDGFSGSFHPFFNSESVEALDFLPNQTKLWKIHGSLGWHYDEETKKVWRRDSDSADILIYPSSLKYSESKKQPYTALLDRLTNFLRQPDTVLITCGYSFGDEHINERIITAINANTSGHVLSLVYDSQWNDRIKTYSLTEDSSLAKIAKENRKLSVYGLRNAVIGGQFGKWVLKREPDKDDAINVSLYFDEDAPFDLLDKIGEEKIGAQIWTGEGELILPDFSQFVRFLLSMMFSE